MNLFNFYIKYPTSNIEYSDWVDITSDVLENSLGSLNQSLSSNEYDIGSIKFNKITVKLRNDTARYSEATNPLSIFTFKRDRSILKIEWERNLYRNICGSTPCGLSFLTSSATEVYQGLLEDNSSKFDADSQVISFNFLGLESIIGKTQVDYSALSNGMSASAAILAILDQSEITTILTVSAGNINVGYDLTLDDVSSLEDKTCLNALDEILFLASSILYVRGTTIYVTDRDPSGATPEFTFYGPSSDSGIENIHDISGYTLGENRTFNFFKWRDTSIKVSFADSIEKFGLRPKEVDSDLVTNSSTQTTIITNLLTEFGFPKIELEIDVPMTTEIMDNLFLLDRVAVDYPADYRQTEGDQLLARYGSAKYGLQSYILSISSLIIDISTNWKIMNRKIDLKKHKLKFRIREV